jgi:hypothetical protein
MDRRHAVALLAGMIGGLLPNDKSNIHPLLMGAILAFLATKVLVGDYDRGYAWTSMDLVFVCVTAAEGVLGAYLVQP